MAWTSPMTFTAGAVLTAAQLNTYLRDNLNETAAAKATTAGQIFVSTGANAIEARTVSTHTVTTQQTTSSTTYANLGTTGPAVTVATGTKALVAWGAYIANDTANRYCAMSIEVSGATSTAASDTTAVRITSPGVNNHTRAGIFETLTLTAGSNTFTAKYRVSDAASTGTFANRTLTVIPL